MAESALQMKKAEVVEELKAKLVGSRVIGLANVTGIPAPQMQRLRSKLRGKVELRVVKNRILLRALERAAEEREAIEGLKDLIEGQTALILTDDNPFKLFKELEGTKSKAPAKGGEVAPADIGVKEGDTPFKPGPVVGDLQKAGIPAAIEKGKVVIKKDKVLVQAGQRIPTEVAQALTRLQIFPLVVGLDLRGVYEDGHIFRRDVLAVDETAVLRDVQAAAASALSLAMTISYPTKDTLPLLLVDAHRMSMALSLAVGHVTRDNLPLLLSKAHIQLLALASRVPEGLDDELKAVLGAVPTEAGAPEKGEEEAKGEKKEEKKEKREGEEEEAAAGLGSLFG